eukprot:scaffold5747_cov128-Isochrysis_galbana.AAC.5
MTWELRRRVMRSLQRTVAHMRRGRRRHLSRRLIGRTHPLTATWARQIGWRAAAACTCSLIVGAGCHGRPT